jgi:hypothetical protein
MADPELVRVLDFILNRSDEASIEAVAAAVVRRKRDLSLFGSSGVPDPKTWARRTAEQLQSGSALKGIRDTVRSMADQMLRKEAPELTDSQRAELLGVWVGNAGLGGSHQGNTAGEHSGDAGDADGQQVTIPPDILLGMVEQFVAFSLGRMPEGENEALRKQLGRWPDRYWKAFPAVVRSVVTEYVKGGLAESDFRMKLRAALSLKD